MIGDPAGYEVMMRVAADENLHQLFYRDMATACIEVDPSGMVIAMDDEVRGFYMPGTGIPGFNEHAKRIASGARPSGTRSITTSFSGSSPRCPAASSGRTP